MGRQDIKRSRDNRAIRPHWRVPSPSVNQSVWPCTSCVQIQGGNFGKYQAASDAKDHLDISKSAERADTERMQLQRLLKAQKSLTNRSILKLRPRCRLVKGGWNCREHTSSSSRMPFWDCAVHSMNKICDSTERLIMRLKNAITPTHKRYRLRK